MNRFLKVAKTIALGGIFSSFLIQAVGANESAAETAKEKSTAPISIAEQTAGAIEKKPATEQTAQNQPANTGGDTAKTSERTDVAKTAHAKASKPKEDLPNFHQVHPFLYRSGEPTEAGLRKLKEMGVKTVIDLRAPSEFPINEPKIAKELGLKYVNLVMTSKAPTEKQVNTMLKEIKKAQEKPEDGSVLVHCAHGSDRTGCMVGIWRVTQEGWSYEDAYKEMRKYWFTPKFTNLSGAVKERASK